MQDWELAQQSKADMEAREAEQAAAAAAAPAADDEAQEYEGEGEGEAAFEDAAEHNRPEAEAPTTRDAQEAQEDAAELVDQPVKNGMSSLDE